jgi:hypothetical protein
MLDIRSLDSAGWRHLTNVLFHTLATLLLFAFLHRATGAPWPSAFAFVFALHPLHVESVAWVAQRKTSSARSSGSSRCGHMYDMRNVPAPAAIFWCCWHSASA